MPAILGGRARAAEASGTVKVVPEVDLKVLDPVWTTALITGTHALLVYDTLFAADRQQRIPDRVSAAFELVNEVGAVVARGL
jgi:peptide/nickel transport system substrate-binding protein